MSNSPVVAEEAWSSEDKSFHLASADFENGPQNFVPWVCVSVTTVISLTAIVGWAINHRELATIGNSATAMRPGSAVGALLLSILVILLNTGRTRLVRVVSGLLSAPLLFALWQTLEAIPSSLQNILPTLSQAALSQQFPELMPANVLAAYFILLCALFLQAHPRSKKVRSAFSFVLALAAICIAVLALFGFLAHVELAYWWIGEMDCPPNTAIVILLLGLAVASYSWTSFGVPSNRISEVIPLLNILASAVLMSTVILSACFSILPLYEALLGTTYAEVNRSLEKTADDVSDFFFSMMIATKALPIPNYLTDDSATTTLPLESDITRFEQVLRDVSAKLPGVVGLHFVSISSEGKEEARNVTLPAAPVAAGRSKQPIIWSTRESTGAFRVFVDVPLENPGIGLIRGEIDLGYLTSLLSHNLLDSARAGTVYLISAVPGQAPLVLLFNVQEDKLDQGTRASIPGELREALLGESQSTESSRRALLRRDRVYFAFPLKRFPALIGFTSQVTPLRSWTDEHLIVVLLGLAFLVVTATALIFILMKKLANQIVVLEERIKESLGSARSEIKLRELAQTELESSLQQKELLLKEVHHRVKNNLQVITSILNLQLRRTSDKDAVVALRESSDRIQSIALLHDTLYRSDNFSRILLADYAQELFKNIKRSYDIGELVTASVTADGVALNLDRAIPLGLIITELVTNSFKHAFGDKGTLGRTLRITIHAEALPNDGLLFQYSDNGIGLPKNLPSEDTGTLGHRLIETLTSQLHGELKIWSENGAQFQITVAPRVAATTTSEREYDRTANFDR